MSISTYTVVTLILRHALGILGGILVAKGYLDSSTGSQLGNLTPEILGAAAGLGAIGLSWLQKRAAEQGAAVSRQLPSGSTKADVAAVMEDSAATAKLVAKDEKATVTQQDSGG